TRQFGEEANKVARLGRLTCRGPLSQELEQVAATHAASPACPTHTLQTFPRKSARDTSALPIVADSRGKSCSTVAAGCGQRTGVEGTTWAELTRIVHSSVARPPTRTAAVVHGVGGGCAGAPL